MSKKIQLKITGMHCGACATGIEMLLSNKKGVEKVKVDYNQRMGEVEYDETKIKAEEMIKEIADLGYQAEIIA